MRTDDTPDTTRSPMGTVCSLDELAGMVKRCNNLHVRISAGPGDDRAGRCLDVESGQELPGLLARPLLAPEWWKRPLEDWLARQLARHILDVAGDRRPWLLTGTDMGDGPDGESLLGHVRPMGWVDDRVLHEAAARYTSRFSQAS